MLTLLVKYRTYNYANGMCQSCDKMERVFTYLTATEVIARAVASSWKESLSARSPRPSQLRVLSDIGTCSEPLWNLTLESFQKRSISVTITWKWHNRRNQLQYVTKSDNIFVWLVFLSVFGQFGGTVSENVITFTLSSLTLYGVRVSKDKAKLHYIMNNANPI